MNFEGVEVTRITSGDVQKKKKTAFHVLVRTGEKENVAVVATAFLFLFLRYF